MLAAQYERQGEEGILALHGAVDIFEAQAVHAAALETLADHAVTVRLDSADAQRLDLSALQVLVALRRDLEAASRSLHVSGLEAAAARAGLSLSNSH